ncbi:hypothetical protein FLAG1_03425 [Fusarium langsethiae]|uniref:Uncharacterized protein n=1 Tax=Fusarium langsethiae TaxID=179993 RepID=A0A0N0V7I8_FUSLA|nr:hypothetical protein FLAG1_03425 [Fusarium langsethiae]GKU01224.1 unnamed protein product [Fusarium langsethiae]GKU11025.1 unnamed protein product [Fusarium langsethiae]
MSVSRTGVQHYLEPLPFRRQKFTDRPLFFSEECDRGHRPSSFDMSDISNFSYVPKRQTSQQFWRELLEDVKRAVPTRSASLGSEACSEPLRSAIERLGDNPVMEWNDGLSRDESSFTQVSPVSENGTLVSSGDVSPLEDYDSSSTDTLLSEYEYDPEPSTTQSEFCHTLTPMLSLHERGYRPAIAPIADCTGSTRHPDSPGTWQQGELSPFSDYIFSDEESLSISKADSYDSPWEEEFVFPTTTGNANASTICYGADTPRIFLEDLSLPNTATGEFVYSQSPAFASNGYGTFVAPMPFTPRSPAYSEADVVLLYRDNLMSDDSDLGVWDFVFLYIGAFMFFAAVSTYVFVLLAMLEYLLH